MSIHVEIVTPKAIAFEDGRRVWAGRCQRTEGGCLEHGHAGECNDGNVSDQDYEVECITAEKMVRKKVLYRIKWKGWPAKYNTWEPLGHLQNLQQEIAAFESSRGGRA